MAKKASGKVELVVRRGALRRFHKLTEKTGDLPVKVSWDRRLSERRSESNQPNDERRTGDRRRTPPFTWDVSDFVVVAGIRRRKRK